MKKTVALIFALTACSPAYANDGWAFWQGQSMPEKQPDIAYRLDVAGYDTRVYEWTPENAPNTVCIAQFSNNGPVGMHCVPKDGSTGQ